LHQEFNFGFLRCPWDAAAYRRVVSASLADAAAVGSRATWVLSNHDVVRPVSVLGLPPGTDLDAWLLSDGSDPKADLALGRRRAAHPLGRPPPARHAGGAGRPAPWASCWGRGGRARPLSAGWALGGR